jgi:CpeT protein
MKKLMLFFAIVIIINSCKTPQTTTSAPNKTEKDSRSLIELVNIMQGVYTSQKQSKSDTSYYDITLRMTPIWTNKGHYLSVEQAISTKLDKPYRVRIYRLIQRNENEFISEIYTLKNEKEWIGKWKNPDTFNGLSQNDIELKQGCEVILVRAGLNKFIGKTGDKTCPSELRGASYATSKVNVYENKIVSWDQGFDKNGKQVWGAEKGGYIFEKVN